MEVSDFKDLRFDIITLIDVIEHLPFPFSALKKVAALLRSGGILMVTTGNTNALPWRLLRLDYWYYTSEHVSFFNPRWFRWAARELDLEMIRMEEFSHQEGLPLERWRQFVQGLSFLILKKLARYPLVKHLISRVYPFNRAVHWRSPPPALLWKDHLLVALQAKQGHQDQHAQN